MNAPAAPLSLALLGHPNSGKTALFNLLTGSRQKVANYAGVTVERKEGLLTTPSGQRVRVLDLPGAYSLNALSADEAVTRDVITGQRAGEAAPDLLVCVVDATNLQLGLRMVLETQAMGIAMVLALNMSDAARRAGITIDRAVLERELGMPVVETVGIRKGGAHELLQFLDGWRAQGAVQARPWQPQGMEQVLKTQQEARRILRLAVHEPAEPMRLDDAIDRVVLHPLWGMLLLAATMFLMFQAVFSWAAPPMEAIKDGAEALGQWVHARLPDGALRSLLVDGILAGVGGVLVFLPQILILFLFILALEDSGYLPRAAFLLDRLMGTVGLSGRSFIPLLSSFACAIPGIMATRTITHWRERLVTTITCEDYFFPLSIVEVGLGNQWNDDVAGNKVLALYDGATNKDRIKYFGTTARYWWLRSTYPWSCNNAAVVIPDGSLHRQQLPTSSYAVVPACSIG
jgi:ferrous iron transport protein B